MSDMKYWDVYRDPLWIWDNLFSKYKVVRIVTEGWGTSNAGSGVVSQEPSYLHVDTGTTASSRGMATAWAHALNAGDINCDRVDWTKSLYIHFFLTRLNSDSEVSARFQLKESTSEGILAQRGVGISISNYDMVGEAYGTARGTVSIGSLTDYLTRRFKIAKLSDRVEFWVDGVLRGTLTGSAVPSVKGDAGALYVASIINGATGGVNAKLLVGNIIVVQEW